MSLASSADYQRTTQPNVGKTEPLLQRLVSVQRNKIFGKAPDTQRRKYSAQFEFSGGIILN